jgi:hypothetical protein
MFNLHFRTFLMKRFLIFLLSVPAFMALIILAGCTNSEITSIEVPYFPVQKEVPRVLMGGLYEGKLVLENRLLLSRDLFPGDESVLIIWPFGYTMEIDGNQIKILNEKGQPAAAVGDNIRMGGGGVSPDWETYVGQPMPKGGIQVPFWLASSVEAYPFFPTYSPGNIEPGRDNTKVEGILALENGYLRLNTTSSDGYLLIWPVSYLLVKKEGQFLVGNSSKGQARPGEKITVIGFATEAETLKKYIFYPLPDDWKGPYWMVTTIEEASNTKN